MSIVDVLGWTAHIVVLLLALPGIITHQRGRTVVLYDMGRESRLVMA